MLMESQKCWFLIILLLCSAVIYSLLAYLEQFSVTNLHHFRRIEPKRYIDVQNLPKERRTKPGIASNRLILVGTSLFGAKEWYNLKIKTAANFANISGCEYNNCEVTYDQNRFQESDAVVFHAGDMPSAIHLKKVSAKMRPKTQRWVYFTSESPQNSPDRRSLNGLFNWTMTFKKESDIWLPYKKYENLTLDAPRPKQVDFASLKNKISNRKLMMWVSSHCGILRDKLILKLQNYISVDVAGRCRGHFENQLPNCDKNEKENCLQQIKNYKFYFAAENGFCDQYVTEKYWYNALVNDAVPVVLGAGPYNDPKVAIPGSFINVADFSTVKALADYLIYLDKNNTAYNEYFSWKQKYKLSKDVGWPFPDLWTCEICRKLNTDFKIKVYHSLSGFWSTESCAGRDKFLVDMINRSH